MLPSRDRLLSRDGQIVPDAFTYVGDDDALPEGADVIVPWPRWQREREALVARTSAGGGRVGVRVSSDRKAHELAPDLAALAVIAVEFPTFTDGRGYSIARHLRSRHGYRGELRAVGNVLRDQIFYMARCGFDAFEVDPRRSAEDAARGLADFTVRYQTAADEPQPLWRRHARPWPAGSGG
jgi:uncharacterized protein (DUF934 family)